MPDFISRVAQTIAQARPRAAAGGSPQVHVPEARTVRPGYGSLGQAFGQGLGVALSRRFGPETKEQLYERAIKAADTAQQMDPTELTQVILDNPHIRKAYLQFAEIAPSRFGVKKDQQGREYAYPLMKMPTKEIEADRFRYQQAKEASKAKEAGKGTGVAIPQDVKESESRIALQGAQTEALDLESQLMQRLEDLKVKAAEKKNTMLQRQLEEMIALFPSKKRLQEAQATSIEKETQREEEAFPLKKDLLQAQIFKTYQDAQDNISRATLIYNQQYKEDKELHDTWTKQVAAAADKYAKMPQGDPAGYTTDIVSQSQALVDAKGSVSLTDKKIPVSNAVVDPLIRQKVDIALNTAFDMFRVLGYGNVKEKEKIFEQAYTLYMNTYGTLTEVARVQNPEDPQNPEAFQTVRRLKDPELRPYMNQNIQFYLKYMRDELTETSKATQMDMEGM